MYRAVLCCAVQDAYSTVQDYDSIVLDAFSTVLTAYRNVLYVTLLQTISAYAHA